MKRKEKQIISFQVVCCVLTIVSICCAIWVFPNAFVRIKESFGDFWSSICYYANQLFGLGKETTPSVNDYSVVPFTPIFNLPPTWEEFRLLWNEYWQTFATLDNLKDYFSYLSVLLLDLSKWFLLVVVPVLVVGYMLLKRYLSKHNNDYNKDSRPLQIIKKFASKFYIPLKQWFFSFLNYVKKSNFLKLWVVIWLYNFNIITILIEFFAFYFYFVVSFDLTNVYRQFYKLFCDLTTPIAFIPTGVWLVLIYWFICYIREKIAYKRLRHFERKNCGFINERSIAILTCGTMGKGKTTLTTDMSLSQEVMFRDKAFELMVENDYKFPNFPWCNLENAIKDGMRKHYIYNLATCRQFIDYLELQFHLANTLEKPMRKSLRRYLKKKFGFNYTNFIFDYDYERYGYTYDDKLKVVDIWQVLKTYSQLYFIYIIQCSYLLTNFSIRTDNIIEDLGNFPLWDTDFFKRDSRVIDKISKHSHIVDFDALRLGKKVLADNPKKDSFEFGIWSITELGKERKNTLELKETKKGEVFANQKNDGFTDGIKMIRHFGTVDNFPFVRILGDEQRPESLGADARDLAEIITIADKSKKKLAMPFFTITELLYSFVFNKFIDLYYSYRHVRGDNTLFIYGMKKIVGILHRYYSRIYNKFGYSVLNIHVENGTMDGQFAEHKYYLMFKKIYSKRFSTDCFSDYFMEKTLRSDLGLADLEEYVTEKATFEELQKQNSYFVNDLIERKDN